MYECETDLLELLDRTLVNTTALVDQVCPFVSLSVVVCTWGREAYGRWWSTCRSRRGR